MPDQSLLTAFDEIRGKTLKLIQVPDRDVLWHPAGTDNHILWHAGHIFAMVERLVIGALKEVVDIKYQIPNGWWPLFGWNSQPEKHQEAEWPSLAEVDYQLRSQYTRLHDILVHLSEGELSRPLQRSQSGWNGAPIRRVVLHAFHDEACHGGEIWLLRKLLARGQ